MSTCLVCTFDISAADIWHQDKDGAALHLCLKFSEEGGLTLSRKGKSPYKPALSLACLPACSSSGLKTPFSFFPSFKRSGTPGSPSPLAPEFVGSTLQSESQTWS